MKKIYLSLFAVLIAAVSFAQVDRSKMPEPGPAPKIDLGETQSFTLENGLKVFVVENHKLPRVAFSMVLDIDPIKEGDKAGAADMAGDLISKGTKSKTKDQINFAVDFIGADFYTSATSVYGSSLKKHQDKILEIMADVVKNSDFKQDELDKLKTQYISGIQSQKDDPDAIANNVRNVLLYGKDHPYGEIMTEETVANITLDDAKSFYQTYFKPNVAYMAVVGDITLKEAKPLIQKYFADWKKGEVPSFTYPMPESPKMTEVAFVNKPGAVQSVISVFNTIDLEPGSADDIKASITNGILGGGFVSKLNLNLREAHAYTYGARSSIDSDELVGSFEATAKVRNEVTDSALTETLKELMAMRNGDITQEELDAQKNYRTGTFAYSLENPQTKARFAINTEKYKLAPDYYANYLKNLAAVTLADAKAMSAKYINPMQGYILVVGNKDEVAEKIKAFSPTGTVKFYDSFGNIAVETLKAAPADVTAESVIDDYINAIGGRKVLDKISSVKTTMSTSMQGMPIQINVTIQNPSMLLSEVKSGEMVFQKQVFNGEIGKTTSMQGNKVMTADEVAKMKYEAAIFPELNYSKEGYTLELKGMDKLDDKDVYVIDVTNPNGDKQREFYSADSKLLVKTIITSEMQGTVVTEENFFSDYKVVKKVMIPHKINSTSGPQQMEMKVESVEFNKKYDASMFEPK
ncbi:MAG: insulinase family protein [Bacteroidetes bacterium]|nr:MAG: insulinase family protein [Bacteroidota bacterium]MBL1144509.1 insulinase family protein [Bacteroidota bacterium]NOG57304.1 insulinase family protein [Bacteroidota bacterium]